MLAAAVRPVSSRRATTSPARSMSFANRSYSRNVSCTGNRSTKIWRRAKSTEKTPTRACREPKDARRTSATARAASSSTSNGAARKSSAPARRAPARCPGLHGPLIARIGTVSPAVCKRRQRSVSSSFHGLRATMIRSVSSAESSSRRSTVLMIASVNPTRKACAAGNTLLSDSTSSTRTGRRSYKTRTNSVGRTRAA